MPWQQITKRALLGATICGLLHACAVGPDYHKPEMRLPDAYAVQPSPSPSAVTIDAAHWWQALGDAELSSLIDRALKANPRLDIALAHVQEAREQEAVVLGRALPELDLSGGAARGTGSDLARGRAAQSLISAEHSIGGFDNVTQVYGFSAAWELDLFGKYRREFQAVRADERAAEAARSEVLISIVADVARAYVDLRGLQMQAAVLRKNIEVAQQYVDLVGARYELGITNGLDVTLAKRQLSTLKAQAAPLDAGIAAAQFVIAVYCGEFPETLVQELSTPGQVPQVPESLSTGVPVDLLRRRPDIHEAEQQLASATARVGVATADLFPHVSISGSAGYQGQGLGVTPALRSFIWSAGPAASLPLLDFGTLDALVNVADYRMHAMLINYKQTVLEAVNDVDRASSRYGAQQDRLRNLREALDASHDSVDLATQRFDRGLTDSLNVVDAQRQEFNLEQEYVIAQQTAADDFIELYKALGSGWEDYQQLPKIRKPLPAVIAALTRSVKSNDLKKDEIAQGMAPR